MEIVYFWMISIFAAHFCSLHFISTSLLTRVLSPSLSLLGRYRKRNNSGTWETSVVHNYRNFVRHCGVAFARSKLDARVVSEASKTVVDTCEIRSISHRENTLADVLVSENGVSLTNITEIGKRRVIVYPDGATSTVESRWDGDVWVEADELNLLETRRWLEKGFLIIARTISTESGDQVTSTSYFEPWSNAKRRSKRRSGMKRRLDSMVELARANSRGDLASMFNNEDDNYGNEDPRGGNRMLPSTSEDGESMTSMGSERTREEEEDIDSSLDSRIGYRNKNGRGGNNYYSDDSTVSDQDTFDATEEFDNTSSQQQTHTGTEKSGSTSYSQYIFGFFQMPDFSSFGLSLPTFDELFGNKSKPNHTGTNGMHAGDNINSFDTSFNSAKNSDYIETARAFNLPYTAECLGSFDCTLSSAQGVLRVFRDPFCACFDGGEGKRWFAHAGDFQALQINGDHEILVKWVTAQSLAQQNSLKKKNKRKKDSGTRATAVRFQNFGEFRDQAFDCIVAMLESAPGLEANEDQYMDTEDNESLHGMRPEYERGAIAALQVGYYPERFVFVEIESLLLDERMRDRVGKRSKPVINISVGQHASSAKTTRLGYDVDSILKGGDSNASDSGEQKFEVEKFFAFPASDVDCNAGRIAVVITVPVLKTQEPAHGEENEDLGRTSTTTYATLALGEASIPLAILETSSRAAVPFTANLSAVKNIEATLQDINPKPATKNGAKGVGSIRCRAWLGTRSEAIEVGAPNIRPETLKRGKSKDFASSKATKNLHMALHNVEDDDADSSDDEKAAVLFGEGPLRKDVSNRPIVRVAPRTCKVFVRISSVRGIPEAEAGKNSNGVVLRCSLLNDSRDLGIFKAKKAGQPATRFFLGDGNMKEAEDSDVVCFEVEEPIVNAIVKIDVYSNKEGAKNVKIGRFCIDCSGMPKTVCKDSRSSFFKINQRTGVPLSLGNGKFKLLRSPKKAKAKARVNVDANGEFTFAGKSKLKPLSTLSGFTATESADRSGTTVTSATGNVAARSDGASMSNTSFTNGRSIEPNDVEYLGEVKVATRIVRSIDPLATPIVGSTRVRILKMRHVPSGSAPGIAIRHDLSWAWLPNASARSPAGWKREFDVAIRDVTKPVHIGVFDRARADERIGVCTIYPSSLPSFGRDIVATVPLRSEDDSEVTGEITVKASFRKAKSNGLFRRTFSTNGSDANDPDAIPASSSFGGFEDAAMSVGYYARGKQLARQLLFGINDMDDDILVRDPSVAFAHLSGKFGGGLNTRHHREEREKREAQRLALIAGINKLPSNIVDTLMFEKMPPTVSLSSSALASANSSFAAAAGELGRRGAKIGEFATVPPRDPAASSSSDVDDLNEEEEALGIDAIRAKAAVIRISIALQPFAYALKRLERAVRWRDYASSASLHLALLFFCFFPNYIVAFMCFGFVVHCSSNNDGTSACLFGAEKSRNNEILRSDSASEFTNFPPGSKFDAPIGWFSTVVRGTEFENEGLLKGPKQLNDALFDRTMQVIFWVQCQLSYFADFMETLRKETLRWEDGNYRNCVAALAFATTVGAITVFIPFGFIVSSLAFYALRPSRLSVPKYSIVKLRLNNNVMTSSAEEEEEEEEPEASIIHRREEA